MPVNKPNQNEQIPPKPQSKTLIYVLLLVVLLSLGVSGFLFYQNYELKQQLSQIQKSFITTPSPKPTQLPTASASPSPTETTYDKEKTECISKGGEWKLAGLALDERCFIKMKDANKDCSNSDDCEGTCLAPEKCRLGDKVVGKCSEYDLTLGCHSRVEGGKAMPVLCID